jgi:signal transduction histidine kinase
MPKQVSALNTIWIVRYLRDHHPQVGITDILDSACRKTPFYVEDLRTGEISPIRVEQLETPGYWFSNRFMISLYEAIQERIPDPDLGYEIGKSCYHSLPFHKVAILAPFLGPQGVLRRIRDESNKYNRTKQTILMRNDREYAKVRLIHNHGIIINQFAMDWHAGVFHAFGKASGAKRISVTWKEKDSQFNVVDFEIRYKLPNLLSRILFSLLFNMPPVKQALDHADSIQRDHREQILNRDAIIRDKTEKLLKLQNELIRQERLLTEKHLAGGMAHEIRNTLGAAKLRLRDFDPPNEGSTNLDWIYRLFSEINQFDGLPDEAKKRLAVVFRKLIANYKLSEKNIHEIERSIDRGLRITNRVMDYSTLHSEDEGCDIDLKVAVEELVSTYTDSLKGHRISVYTEIEENLKICASDEFLHSIVQNLILNAKDAILEAAREHGEILLKGFRRDDGVVFEVSDNGIGIPEANLKKLFQPFFTTKPAMGMGLGLSECQKLVTTSGGRIEVESRNGQGALFRIVWD